MMITMWNRPWWFPGPLLRAFALVALGFLGHLVRLSRDPWNHQWRVPGRTLLLVLLQALPLAFLYLIAWVLLGRWIDRPVARRLARWLLAAGLLAFCVSDGAYAAYADRHLLEPGQLSFLFREGALWASGVVTLPIVVALAALLSLVAWLLVERIGDIPQRMPIGAAVISILGVLAINSITLYSIDVDRRDLYAYAISANPLHGMTSVAQYLAIGARPAVSTTVAGLRPLREVVFASNPNPIEHLSTQPRLILVLLLDGFRSDFLTPDRAPELSTFAARHGVVLQNYYTSYPGTDRSIYSLLFSDHPFFADQSFKMGSRPPAPWVVALRKKGYQTEAFQSNPGTYRFLPLVLASFDRYWAGTANADPLASDAAMLTLLDDRVRRLKDGEKLFAFVLFHSTHYPYNGKRFGSMFTNYSAAVRFLDQKIGAFLQRLFYRNESFLAFVGGDHGTLLGECGKPGYSVMHPKTLHTAMAAIGSPSSAPALVRLERAKDAMVQPQTLFPLALDPRHDPSRSGSPDVQWNVAVMPGVSGVGAPLMAHNLAGDAMSVELARNEARWQCGRLDDCVPFGITACRENLLAGAARALLAMEGGRR